MKLSDKLTSLRKEKGWSQEDFAEKLDISRQAISRWENGTALPDAQNLLRISKLFNVTADYLLCDDFEGESHSSKEENVSEETVSVVKKQKFSNKHLILTIGLIAIMVCMALFIILKTTAHTHSVFNSVKENEIASTCITDGSYEDVIYCTECDEELSRTIKSIPKISHTMSSFVKENEVSSTCKSRGSYDEVFYCTVCNKEILRNTISIPKLSHTLSSVVTENSVAPTCVANGSYDEVVYCKKCGIVLVRTKKTVEKLEHQFQDRKCIGCGKSQPSEGLNYMSNGNGTCIVSIGDCTDEHIVVPERSPSGDKVTDIKAYSFAAQESIKSVQIPETVTFIGEGAFENCENLESINLPSKLLQINNYTFKNCISLKEIKIPSNVYYIGTEAFDNCIACQSVFIPASVYKIGKFAFRNFSECKGTVTFAVHDGWGLYDGEGRCFGFVDFKNTMSTPTLEITFYYPDYRWIRE